MAADRDEIDRVRTIRAGNFVNLAHATGGAFVASVSKVRRPPKGQNLPRACVEVLTSRPKS